MLRSNKQDKQLKLLAIKKELKQISFGKKEGNLFERKLEDVTPPTPATGNKDV